MGVEGVGGGKGPGRLTMTSPPPTHDPSLPAKDWSRQDLFTVRACHGAMLVWAEPPFTAARESMSSSSAAAPASTLSSMRLATRSSASSSTPHAKPAPYASSSRGWRAGRPCLRKLIKRTAIKLCIDIK